MVPEVSGKRSDLRCSYLPSSEFNPVSDIDALRKAEYGVVGFYGIFCPLHKKLLERLDDLAAERDDVIVRSCLYKGVGRKMSGDFGSANEIVCVPALLIVHNGLAYARNDVYKKIFSKKEFLDYLSNEMESIKLSNNGNTLRFPTATSLA